MIEPQHLGQAGLARVGILYRATNSGDRQEARNNRSIMSAFTDAESAHPSKDWPIIQSPRDHPASPGGKAEARLPRVAQRNDHLSPPK